MDKKYQFAVMGGTFDRLHAGHKKLLELAFGGAEVVVIGLTSDEFVIDKTLAELTLPYYARLEELEKYLLEKGLTGRYEIVKIETMYGTTLEDERFEAIVVSEETKKGAEKINQERVKKGMGALPIEVAELVRDGSGEKISSARIRQGVVSREGVVYAYVFERGLVMSGEQKEVLAKPMDELFIEKGELKNYYKVAVVGDSSLLKFEEDGLRFDLAVYDWKIGRKPLTQKQIKRRNEAVVTNEAGKITVEVVREIKKMVEKGSGMLRVEGEEDLLTLPMVLMLPLECVVIYGQPGDGVVGVKVTEEAKDRWYEFLAKG